MIQYMEGRRTRFLLLHYTRQHIHTRFILLYDTHQHIHTNITFSLEQELCRTPHMKGPSLQDTVEQFDMNKGAWTVSKRLGLSNRHSDFACVCA